MNPRRYLLAIDQGTTSTKAIILNHQGVVISTSSPERFELEPHYPQPGWVEYQPEQIWESLRGSAQAAVRHANVDWSEIAALGLANQGETVIAFDGRSGEPVGPAISWQDRRGEGIAAEWRSAGFEPLVMKSTGLRLDPYFSAPKLAWILRHVPIARQLLAQGHLRLGTSDSWLLWKLTAGRVFATDVSTASRSMLLDLETLQWNESLCESFGIPLASLPSVCSNAVEVGSTERRSFGASIPITGLCVDQQAALFGQRAFEAGQAKVTYGTGCFLLANIGSRASVRAQGLLTSVGWKIGTDVQYAFDGGIYSAGSLIDWLIEIGLIDDYDQLSRIAFQSDSPSSIVLIPAFSGLAAPHWSGKARACWLGMDQGTDRHQLVRSAMEAIAFRVKEIFDSMACHGLILESIQVDGGLTRCEPLMQLQADLLQVPLERRAFTDATALGVAYLAGLGSGLWSTPSEIPPLESPTKRFEPCELEREDYRRAYSKWKRHCAAVIAMGEGGLFDP